MERLYFRSAANYKGLVFVVRSCEIERIRNSILNLLLCLFPYLFSSLMAFLSFLLCAAAPCTASLGMESHLIKDAQITASSEWDSNHAAIQARLNFKEGGGKRGAWSARSNDTNQWIQVALWSYTKLTGISTQGRNGASQWVTKYQLQYSDDGVNFHYYKEASKRSPKVKPYQSDNCKSLHAFMATILQLN